MDYLGKSGLRVWYQKREDLESGRMGEWNVGGLGGSVGWWDTRWRAEHHPDISPVQRGGLYEIGAWILQYAV